MLCGTREDVAARAMAFHAEAGLELPLLQPVLQEDDQIDELIAAAALYAGAAASRAAGVGAGDGRAARRRRRTRPPVRRGVGLADDRRARRRIARPPPGRRAWEILRPFAYTASVIPVARRRGARRASTARSPGAPFLAALLGGVLLHFGTNVVNEIYDVRQGIDTITSPRASHAIVKGRHDRARGVRDRAGSPSGWPIAHRRRT